MSFDNLLDQCYTNLGNMACCHHDNRICDCYDCLQNGFRNTTDEYDCHKKMNFYVLKYGSSYASETYQYLDTSKILDLYNNRNINVLSLGCGFSPDYYAINKYIVDNSLNIKINYYGVDKSNYWDTARIHYANLNYLNIDLTTPFNISDFDLIIMNKIFSTLLKHQEHEIFLNNLRNAIATMKHDATLVFNDINSNRMGRDIFNNAISPLFVKIRRYYSSITPKYTDQNWMDFSHNDIVFPTCQDHRIDPLRELRDMIYFEYRKS